MRVLALIAVLVGCALGYPETTPKSAALQPADAPGKAASPGGSKAPQADENEHRDDPLDEEDQTPLAGLDPADGTGEDDASRDDPGMLFLDAASEAPDDDWELGEHAEKEIEALLKPKEGEPHKESDPARVIAAVGSAADVTALASASAAENLLAANKTREKAPNATSQARYGPRKPDHLKDRNVSEMELPALPTEYRAGWRLVRRTNGTKWHPATDKLDGTDSYGEPTTDYANGGTFSVPWDPHTFDEFAFTSGDMSKWLVAAKREVVGPTGNAKYGWRSKS